MDQTEALRLATEASELWQAGELLDAERRYRQALAQADAGHYRTPDIHSELANLLVLMNRLAEAGAHYERALQLELKGGSREDQPGLVAARYCLGEHYLRMGEADSARRVVAPSLAAADKPLAWLVEAEALFLCGDMLQARRAGERALALAADDAQRERLRARLAALWQEG